MASTSELEKRREEQRRKAEEEEAAAEANREVVDPDADPDEQKPATKPEVPVDQDDDLLDDEIEDEPADEIAVPSGNTNPATWTSTLDDPNVVPGRYQNVSNYLEDAAVARYRAAVYWLARHPDAIGKVPENVSAGVNALITNAARRMEREFNNGNPFPATPVQVRKVQSQKKAQPKRRAVRRAG